MLLSSSLLYEIDKISYKKKIEQGRSCSISEKEAHIEDQSSIDLLRSNNRTQQVEEVVVAIVIVRRCLRTEEEEEEEKIRRFVVEFLAPLLYQARQVALIVSLEAIFDQSKIFFKSSKFRSTINKRRCVSK